MNIMALDLEMNQPSRKIIEVGAAVYNGRTGLFVEKLSMFINPGEKIEPFITDLTGITDQDVSNGFTIIQGYEELRRLHKKHKCFMNPLVWGSGTRNDSQAIFEETKLAGENFMGFRVLDVKTIFQSVQIHHGQQHGMGLKEACERLKIGFEGSNHRAVVDAMNTFRIWFHMVKGFQNEK